MSSVYWPLPVMNRWSSLRLTDAPTPVSAMAFLLEIGSCSTARRRLVVMQRELFRGLPHGAHIGRAGLHGGDDVVVARAAAQVALEPLADGVLVELPALGLGQRHGRHDHAGRAEAALQAVVL